MHTPPPWKIGNYEWVICAGADGEIEVAQVFCKTSDWRANVCLVAEAPTLLALCRESLRCFSGITAGIRIRAAEENRPPDYPPLLLDVMQRLSEAIGRTQATQPSGG